MVYFVCILVQEGIKEILLLLLVDQFKIRKWNVEKMILFLLIEDCLWKFVSYILFYKFGVVDFFVFCLIVNLLNMYVDV